MNQAGGYTGLGSVFNRWWLPNGGGALPESGPFAGEFSLRLPRACLGKSMIDFLDR
eukprot:COSAG06_NODE_353_length_16899_cov_14.694345_4_plen_56_part_00